MTNERTDVYARIAAAVCSGDREVTIAEVERALADGAPPLHVLSGGLIAGLQQLGGQFKDGQAFLPEILIGVRAMETGLTVLKPSLVDQPVKSKGTVVIGTVEGDLHDIGKKLVAMLLSGNGFTVIDLGVDVSADDFVAAARKHDPDVVALSALLTTTTPQFRKVVERLDEADLRGRVLVMVGGAPVTASLAAEVGADGFAEDCVTAVDEALRLVTMRRRA
jgi:5-methyltetrahydrofolate--homocysteine methyltransferase